MPGRRDQDRQRFGYRPITMTDQRESHLPDPVRADFLKLFLEHQDDLRAFIGAVVRDSAQRDDVFQEVAMELWRGFDRYDPQRSFGAWARGVAKHRVMKHYRSEGRVPMPLSPAAVEATLNAFDAIDDFRGAATDWKDALEACLQQMPAQSRKLLSMRYDNESDIGSIASVLRKTVDAIYQSLSRIRKQLEICVRERLRTQP